MDSYLTDQWGEKYNHNFSDKDAFGYLKAMSRHDYEKSVAESGGLEDWLMGQAKGTHLLPMARQNARRSAALAEGVQERNTSRYGTSLPPALQAAQQRSSSLMGSLGEVQSLANARTQQFEMNSALGSSLYGLGSKLDAQTYRTAAAGANRYVQDTKDSRARKDMVRDRNIGIVTSLITALI